MLTKMYTSFILKMPFIPIIFTLLLSILVFVLTIILYGFWPTCNSNYYRWSRDETTEKWNSYLTSTKSTYSSLEKLLKSYLSIPYRFDLTQMGCIFYQNNRKSSKTASNSNPISIDSNTAEPRFNSSNNFDEIDDEHNMLSVEALREVWNVEDQMHKTPGWEEYCYKIPYDIIPSFLRPFFDEILNYMRDHLSDVEAGTNCMLFKSVITELKDYMKNTLKIPNPTSDQLTTEIIHHYLSGYDDLNRSIEGRLKITFFGTDYHNFTTTRLRSMVIFGLPLKGYMSKHDRFIEQERKLGKWQIEFLKPLYAQTNNESSRIHPCAAFPEEMEYEIFDIVVEHIPYFLPGFIILDLVFLIYCRSIYLAVTIFIGMLCAILSSIGFVNLIFQIHHYDVIHPMSLITLMISAGVVNIYIYRVFIDSSTFLYFVNKITKIAIVTLLFNSFSALPILISGIKIVQFFGIYQFALTLIFFLFVFLWILPTYSLYCKIRLKRFQNESETTFERYVVSSNDQETDKEPKLNTSLLTPLNQQSYTDMHSVSIDSMTTSEDNQATTTTNSSTNVFSYAESTTDYPHKNLFDFFKFGAEFNRNATGKEPLNLIEKVVALYIWPFMYFYRFVVFLIVVMFFILNFVFLFRIETKHDFDFLDKNKNHRLQRSVDLSRDGFRNPLNDNAFVYVWGLDKTPKNNYESWSTVNSYGSISTFKTTEINKNSIVDPRIQEHIMETYEYIMNQSDFIDVVQSEHFGFNPWSVWSMIIDANYGPFDLIFKLLNLTKPPKNIVNITREEYNSYELIWQTLLSLTTMEEADNYIPGTLKRNTLGFSYEDYSLQFIGLKANMYLTPKGTYKELKEQYQHAKQMEKYIQSKAVERGIPEFKGYMTSAAWIPLILEEKIVVNSIIIFFVSLVPPLLASLIFMSYKMVPVVLLSSFVVLCMTFGSLSMFLQLKFGPIEHIMVAFYNSLIVILFQIPFFDVFSPKFKNLSPFGRIQASLMNSAMSFVIIIPSFWVGSVILLFCPFKCIPPFVPFMMFAALYALLANYMLAPIILLLLI